MKTTVYYRIYIVPPDDVLLFNDGVPVREIADSYHDFSDMAEVAYSFAEILNGDEQHEDYYFIYEMGEFETLLFAPPILAEL